jgi:hypothetical protein
MSLSGFVTLGGEVLFGLVFLIGLIEVWSWVM